MLFNEPKLLKLWVRRAGPPPSARFSALQRAEIAEIELPQRLRQRVHRFSALQRAEIAEIGGEVRGGRGRNAVSVLFNEPKLLKYDPCCSARILRGTFQCSSTSRNC